MLPRFTCSLVFSVALFAACGGPDTSNPGAACNSLASSFCNKAQSCGSSVTSSCASQVQNALDCAHVVCPAGTTFDSSTASQCIDAVNGLSCGDAANGTLPSACHSVCR